MLFARRHRYAARRFFCTACAWVLLAPCQALCAGQAELAASFHAGGPIAAFRECRFLSLAGEHDDQRRELSPQEYAHLVGLMRNTSVGTLVASELEKFRHEGLGGDTTRPLRIYSIARDMGPSAEYFETGEMHLRSDFVDGLGDADQEKPASHLTAASFVVHEAVHAIAHHLWLTGEFAAYQPDTKVNEALAYFIQGLYLDGVRAMNPDYREDHSVPAWDLCSARIVGLLGDYGITPQTSFEDAYDLFAELQLEVDETQALRLSKLWQYFQFLHDSDETDALWRLREDSLPKIKVVESVTDLIWLDVERRNCDFDNTFSLMRNRIILYANYADSPPDTTNCEYFTGFVEALRSEGEISKLLRQEIDAWLDRRRHAAKQREEPR